MARSRTATAPVLNRLPAAFTRSGARDVGLTSTLLTRLLEDGVLDRFARGVFRQVEKAEQADLDLLEAALRAPRATICLNSALAVADLTDAIPVRWSLAVSRGTYRPSGPATVVWHQIDPVTFDVGRGEWPLARVVSIGRYGSAQSRRCVQPQDVD